MEHISESMTSGANAYGVVHTSVTINNFLTPINESGQLENENRSTQALLIVGPEELPRNDSCMIEGYEKRVNFSLLSS